MIGSAAFIRFLKDAKLMIGVVIILLACETAINIPMLIVVYFIVNPQVTSSPT